MENEFDIRKSNKSYINSPEKFIVSIHDEVLLRILGEEPSYELMTSTTGEDNNGIYKVGNQQRLIAAALMTANELGTKSSIQKDYKGREYVKICRFEYISDGFRVSEKFISIYNKIIDFNGDNSDCMSEIYSSLSVDDSGGDVYLSDGVWLSSDGTLKDIGR